MKLFTLLIFISIGSSAVISQAAEEDRRQRANIQVKEEKRKKSSAPGRNQLNRSAIITMEVEKKLIKGIDATTRYLQKQADRMQRQSSGRLNLLDKVLNLHFEQAAYLRNEEEREYSKRWDTWDANNRAGKEPRIDTKRSHQAWLKVAASAENIMKEYPRHKSADVVLFNQAQAMLFLGKEKDAARIFTQLIQKYPNSPVAGDAFASLGDFYFDRDDFRNATNNFKQTLRYKRSRRYVWSIFKLGWCSYNLGRNHQALTYWKNVVQYANTQKKPDALKLKDLALRDMVYAFAEVQDIEGAISYYKANGGRQYIGGMLLLLAKTLSDQGKFPVAIKTLKRFQTEIPFDPEGPGAQEEIITLAYELGSLNTVWRELSQFSEMYGANSPWAKKNANDRKLVLETQQKIKDKILYYSKLTHKRAQDSDSEPLHKQAKAGYLLFLRNYAKAKEVAEVKFNLADIEYFLKDYRSAGNYFLQIAMLPKDQAVIYTLSGKTQNIHRTSAQEMVGVYAKDFLGEFRALKNRTPDFTKPRRPLSVRAKNYIKACGHYTKWYPDDKKRIKTCDIDITRIYYHSNDPEQSKRYLWIVAIKYPQEKEGPESVEQLIPLYKDEKSKLLKIADRLLKIPAYQTGDLGKKLRALRRGAEVESIAQEKDILKRARMYEEHARKYPNGKETDKLWYNAAVDYLKAGAVPSAIAAYLAIVKQHPKSEQAQESLLQVAKLYEARLEFDNASQYFVVFAEKYPKAKETPGAMAKSCELLIAIESEKAISKCLTFARQYPEGSVGAIERLIKGAYRKNNYAQMTQLIRNHYLPKYKLSASSRIVALNYIFEAYKGNGTQAAEAARDMRAAFQQSGGNIEGEALRYIGRLEFMQAEREVPKYLTVKLTGGTVDRLAQSLDRKAAALNQVKQAFERVIATKDSYWGVAALHQIGYAHEHFSELMKDPPAIQGAKKEDVLKQIGPQIDQLVKESKNWYKIGLDSVTKFNVYNDWSKKIYNSYARISGSELTFDEWIIEPDFLGSEISSSIISSVSNEE